jgi:hypothetical protein
MASPLVPHVARDAVFGQTGPFREFCTLRRNPSDHFLLARYWEVDSSRALEKTYCASHIQGLG